MKNQTKAIIMGVVGVFLFLSLLVVPSISEPEKDQHYLNRNMKVGEVLIIKIQVGEFFRYMNVRGFEVSYDGMINDEVFVMGGVYVRIGMVWEYPYYDPPHFTYEVLSGTREHVFVKITRYV